jgi:nucleotide-binding universal stress UspA family protein
MAPCGMPTTKKRRVFEDGHRRKLMVIVDESKEVESALLYAASRASHTGGHLALLFVIEPDNQIWGGVRQAQLDEGTAKAKALFRLFRRKLNNEGFDKVEVDEVIREGKLVEQIMAQIEDDEDVAILVLGAAVDAKGPGPLISLLASGASAGKFPIPITIVPGDLTVDDIKTMA